MNILHYDIDDAHLTSPVISRIDFCFDDYHHEYRSLYKLNQLLFYIFAKQNNIKNDYASRGIRSPVPKTLRIQKKEIEAEFYNKKIQEPTGNVSCRLELRRKGINIGINDVNGVVTVLRQWLFDLNEITTIKNRDLDNLFAELNDEIMTCYAEDVRMGDYAKTDYKSLIQRYCNYIFTRRQLNEIIRRMGFKSHESITSKFKDSHRGLEFFKPYELRNYIEHINQAAETFLGA